MADRLVQAGLEMEKKWEGARDSRTSKACLSNMDIGWIPIAQAFPSGAMQPLNHPGCRHTALYRRMKTPKAEVKPKEVVPEPPDMQVAKNARQAMLNDDFVVAGTKKIQELETEIKEIRTNLAGFLRKTPSEKIELEAQRQLWGNRKIEIIKEMTELRQSIASKSRSYVYTGQRSNIRVEIAKGLSQENRLALEAGLEDLNKMVSPNVLADAFTNIEQTRSGRAYFLSGTNTVYLSKAGSSPRTVIHELGHWLEDSGGIGFRQKVFDFYENRTAGYRLEKMPGIGYSAKEKTRVDKFIDPYMGKDYTTLTGERDATEILSMGVEYFYKDPVQLATEDPEYFDFIFDLLRGR
jgi:hypothetical protein